MSQSRSLLAGYRALATLAALGAAGGCNYDFDEFSGLAPPLLDSGSSTKGGAAGAGPSDATGGSPGKGGAAGGAGTLDAGNGGGAGGAGGSGAAGTGLGGNAGSSGATGSGGAGGAGAVGGSGGAGGTAGSSGSGGTGAGAGTAGAAGAGATGGVAGTGGSGGSTVDAGVDGAGGGGTGGTGTGGAGTGSGGTAGTGTGGASGAGSGGTGTSGAAGTGGTGTGGAGTGGTAGVPPPEGGTRPDIRVADIKLDRVDPPFDCAAVGGRMYEKHCYYAKTTPVTWEIGAKESCPAPAHLVTITSPGEQTFVVSFLTDESRWIGYYRPTGSPKTPSAFEWITGEMSTFSNWYASNGEPDYDGECVRLGPSNNWGDNPCSAAFPVICERE